MGATGALVRAAGAAEGGCSYAYQVAQTLLQSDSIRLPARRVNSVMQKHFEVIFGAAVIVSFFTAPLAFPCLMATGYWAYDKQITNLSGEGLFQLRGTLDHELRNVICLVIALTLHFIFKVHINLTIAFLVGCIIKRMMMLAVGPVAPRPVLLPLPPPETLAIADGQTFRPVLPLQHAADVQVEGAAS